MRKRVQKQIIGLAETIIEGIEYVLKSSGNSGVCHNVLIDCYSGTSAVLEIIKKSVSEEKYKTYFRLISSLQDSLEELNEKILKGEKDTLLINGIKKKTALLKDKIENEDEVKLEVVFLPYKASMWDSLESVWKAASEDKRCCAYVVAVPYFEKNHDGSLGKMHYEGNEYPDYVPITDWQSYDLSREKPDIIYFHNPYDQYNYVTSVHPAFYSSELKKHTDMLVYIPYFVAVSDNVSKHLCSCTGIYNADKVILQSEKVKETYKNTFIEDLTESKENATEEYLKLVEKIAEEKFLALGSPKFDMTEGYEKISIPKDWEKAVLKAGGEKKRVVLYNTTIDALLKNYDIYLSKVESTLKFFKENRDEFALLWRPHPLFENTLSSMLPGLKKEYDEILRAYKKEKWGIFDDTADLNRAIALSDCYYGDWSSVVEIYRQTGKVVMIQKLKDE